MTEMGLDCSSKSSTAIFAFALGMRPRRSADSFWRATALGVRPLSITALHEGIFAFASEVPGAVSGVPGSRARARSDSARSDLHALGPDSPPRNRFAGVSELQPGHCLVVVAMALPRARLIGI